ncbi:hypothetical protein SAMN05216456_1594 [Devosia crocina]|uniref:Uncharacterized protein n=1 Tax=Devosia crocina TaxID=429728 RepID=A0A1I7NC70_9HYPH|nr:hypothetical protein [Devosia crocina]SFV32274.1 hypothetical protein SAMN05216456_1594 [Devosia crocina]
MRQRTFLATRDDAGHARAVVRSVYSGTAADDTLLHNPEETIGLELRNYLKAVYNGRTRQGHAVGSFDGWARAVAWVSIRCDAEVSLASVARHASKIGVPLPEPFMERVALEAAAAKAAGIPMIDAVSLGEMIQLTAAEREEYKVRRLIEACDETPKERINRQRRAKRGSISRANSITAQQPWLADGYKCRRTWERNGKQPKMSQTWSTTDSFNKEEGCSTKVATSDGCSTKVATKPERQNG